MRMFRRSPATSGEIEIGSMATSLAADHDIQVRRPAGIRRITALEAWRADIKARIFRDPGPRLDYATRIALTCRGTHGGRGLERGLDGV